MRIIEAHRAGKLSELERYRFVFMRFGNWPTSLKSKITQEKLKIAIFDSSAPIWKQLGYKNSSCFSKANLQWLPAKENLHKSNKWEN